MLDSAGKEMYPKGLLLHRGWRRSAARNDSPFVYTFRWQSGYLRWRYARVYARSYAGFYKKLLSTLSTGTKITFVNNHKFHIIYNKYLSHEMLFTTTYVIKVYFFTNPKFVFFFFLIKFFVCFASAVELFRFWWRSQFMLLLGLDEIDVRCAFLTLWTIPNNCRLTLWLRLRIKGYQAPYSPLATDYFQ